MHILTICKHNRFRSKVAEALLLKEGFKGSVRSAGLKIDVADPNVAPSVIRILGEHGTHPVSVKPQIVTEELIRWADTILVVADNVDPGLFPAEKVVVWPIRDCDQDDIETIRLRVSEIARRVREFISRL